MEDGYLGLALLRAYKCRIDTIHSFMECAFVIDFIRSICCICYRQAVALQSSTALYSALHQFTVECNQYQLSVLTIEFYSKL